MLDQQRVSNRKTNLPLIIILSILGLVIFILSILVIINFTKNNSSENLSAEEYQNLAMQILNEDTNHERGQEVIDYAVKADKLLQTQDSAVFVLNFATIYDITDIRIQYVKILKQRIIDAGLDPDMEVQG